MGLKKFINGWELNRLIAEDVMGWILEDYVTGRPAKSEADYEQASKNDGWAWSGRNGEAWQFKPAEDLACAMEVLEKFPKEGFILGRRYDICEGKDVYFCDIFRPGFFHHEAHGGPLPQMICIVAARSAKWYKKP